MKSTVVVPLFCAPTNAYRGAEGHSGRERSDGAREERRRVKRRGRKGVCIVWEWMDIGKETRGREWGEEEVFGFG